MSDDFKINMAREDIGNCRGCGADSTSVEFKGRANECVTHMNSVDGWWLRLSHHFHHDYNVERKRLPDTVSTLLCQKCAKDHDERMSTLFDNI